jgi:hypothetical protein
VIAGHGSQILKYSSSFVSFIIPFSFRAVPTIFHGFLFLYHSYSHRKMVQTTVKSALAAVAILPPSAIAGVIDRRMNPNENVLLTYCRDNSDNIINCQMAYFSGTLNGMPSATTIVLGPNHPTFGEVPPGVVIWEQEEENVGTFPDGNTFSSLIRFQPVDSFYTGLGMNHSIIDEPLLMV